jgi:hypothetical protein
MTNTVPVVNTSYSFADLVKKAEGEDYNKPDIAYEFSNGSKKESTDKTSSGIYER